MRGCCRKAGWLRQGGGGFFFHLQAAERSVQTVMGAQRNLRIPVQVLGAEKAKLLRALIETGSETCLVRKGLVEPHQLRPVLCPLRLKNIRELHHRSDLPHA